jgi:hypothetical protein
MKKKGVTELMFLSDGFGGRKGYEHGFTPPRMFTSELLGTVAAIHNY